MGVFYGGDPIAHGFVYCVLQCSAARHGRNHLGAEKFHAKNIEGLTLYVDFTHEDFAFHTHEGCSSCRGDTVLTGASFGDQASLAHALCKKSLTKNVVDLV